MTIQGAQQLKQQTASIKKQTVDLALVSATRRETSGVLSPDVLGVWVVAAVVVACATTTQGVEDPRYSGGVETCEVAPWREIRGRDSVHCLVHVPGGALWASIAGGIRVLGISDSHTRQAAGSGGVVASLDERSSWGAQLGAHRVVSMAACHWLSLFSCLCSPNRCLLATTSQRPRVRCIACDGGGRVFTGHDDGALCLGEAAVR